MSIPSFQGVAAGDVRSLIQDKYAGNTADPRLPGDVERLRSGEPLAYVIGWQPFLGLSLSLRTHPLIPRPETEWWAERLIAHLEERFRDRPFTLLDLCAGSGAIGLAVAKHLPNAHVTLAELAPEHVSLMRENARTHSIPDERISIVASDLFAALPGSRFDLIACNPPYIPCKRALPESVTRFEPQHALYAGSEGLDLIRRIMNETPGHLQTDGELWLEADIANAEQAAELARAGGARQADVINDQYDRPRLVVAYW